jgi:hypothetical protein
MSDTLLTYIMRITPLDEPQAKPQPKTLADVDNDVLCEGSAGWFFYRQSDVVLTISGPKCAPGPITGEPHDYPITRVLGKLTITPYTEPSGEAGDALARASADYNTDENRPIYSRVPMSQVRVADDPQPQQHPSPDAVLELYRVLFACFAKYADNPTDMATEKTRDVLSELFNSTQGATNDSPAQ